MFCLCTFISTFVSKRELEVAVVELFIRHSNFEGLIPSRCIFVSVYYTFILILEICASDTDNILQNHALSHALHWHSDEWQ